MVKIPYNIALNPVSWMKIVLLNYVQVRISILMEMFLDLFLPLLFYLPFEFGFVFQSETELRISFYPSLFVIGTCLSIYLGFD